MLPEEKQVAVVGLRPQDNGCWVDAPQTKQLLKFRKCEKYDNHPVYGCHTTVPHTLWCFVGAGLSLSFSLLT